MSSLPPWMKGKGLRAANGSGRCDRSNGWALNHPIGKMQYYQRWLHAKQTAKPKDVDQKALAALETEVAAAAKAADAEEEDDEEAEAEARRRRPPPARRRRLRSGSASWRRRRRAARSRSTRR